MAIKVTPILPAGLNIKGIKEAILGAGDDEGKDLEKDFEQTTATWEGEKPDFNAQVSLKGGNLSVKVGPTGNKEGVKKWNILNAGAPAHPIEPIRATRLAFQAQGFKAKTKPGKLKSGKGRPAGGETVFTTHVDHPGIEARGWAVTIQRQNKRRFPNRVTRAIKKARKYK